MKKIKCSMVFLLVLVSIVAAKGLSADTLLNWLAKGPPRDFILIDVREVSELTSVIATDNCHPYNLPYTSHVIDSFIPKLPKDSLIIIYCRSGARSGLAMKLLESNGFTNIDSLTGGMLNWTALSGPTKPPLFLKQNSELPSSSMIKNNVSIITTKKKEINDLLQLKKVNECIIAPSTINKQHYISFYNLSGKKVLTVTNPFMRNTNLIISNKIPAGCYVCRFAIQDVEFKQRGFHVLQ